MDIVIDNKTSELDLLHGILCWEWTVPNTLLARWFTSTLEVYCLLYNSQEFWATKGDDKYSKLTVENKVERNVRIWEALTRLAKREREGCFRLVGVAGSTDILKPSPIAPLPHLQPTPFPRNNHSHTATSDSALVALVLKSSTTFISVNIVNRVYVQELLVKLSLAANMNRPTTLSCTTTFIQGYITYTSMLPQTLKILREIWMLLWFKFFQTIRGC